MNQDLNQLQPYPFEKLAQLKKGVIPAANLEHIALSVGEPKHPTPKIITEAIFIIFIFHVFRPPFFAFFSLFFLSFFFLEIQILPVSGTREALFSFAQCVVDRTRPALVLMPNPFYQIYEGAALLSGAQPYFLNCDEDNAYLPDYSSVSDAVWSDCQLLYLCNPGNPSGATHSETQLKQLIELAHQFDFIIAADECYSEIYADEANKPLGLLEVSDRMGNPSFSRCVVFHSLSKRSNAPGLRSGFVAGDAAVLQQYFSYRTYHGCTLPTPTQYASIAAWNDESHVQTNRELYRQKFSDVLAILDGDLDVKAPDAGFYLWAKTPISDTDFARRLFEQQHITVLPGQFLSRNTANGNPGLHHVRMALVAPVDECVKAAHRIKHFLQTL